jgi:hypothetical protein
MKTEGSNQREKNRLSQVTVQPLWKQAVDGRQYAHSELRLRGAWLSDIFPPHTHVHVAREEREGQVVLVIRAAQQPPQMEVRPNDESTMAEKALE